MSLEEDNDGGWTRRRTRSAGGALPRATSPRLLDRDERLKVKNLPLSNRPVSWVLLVYLNLIGAGLLLNTNIYAGQLSSLYDAFIAGPSQPVFVAFEREILVPKRAPQDKETRLSDGRVIRMKTPGKDYFGFLRADERMLLSYSLTVEVTNIDSFAHADTLQGFDGNEYWSLSLNYPIQMLSARSRGGTVQTNKALNRLRIVPRSELSADVGGATQYIPTVNIVELLHEGLLVSQFGCSRPLEGAPTSTDSWLQLSAEGSREPIRARQSNLSPNGLPKTIEYPSASGYDDMLVELSQEDNTLTITRRARGRVYLKILYHILAVYQPQSPLNVSPLFSWKTYQGDAGPLEITLRTNHSDFVAGIGKDGEVEKKRALPTSVAFANVRGRGTSVRRSLVLGCLALITTIAMAFLFRSVSKQKAKPEKGN